MQSNTLSLLQCEAPAALATHPREGLSERYSFFSTRALVDALEHENWTVVKARQSGGRSSDPRFRKHELFIADRNDFVWNEIGEYPRVILTNSHDGQGKLKVQAGLWRMYCDNGIVVSDGFIQSVAIRHSHRTIEEAVTAAQSLRENAQRIREHVIDFKQIELTPAAAVEFARRSIEIRFGEGYNRVAPEHIVSAQRPEDAQDSLWNVFNRAQEWLIKGGFEIASLKAGKARTARPIKSLDESSRINTGLWDLAEEFRNS